VANVQVVILAGGLGSRLAEETHSIPKPMVTIGEEPILLHLMRYFASFGHVNFVIALGYKGSVIKDYFRNFTQNSSSLRIQMTNSEIEILNKGECAWTIDLIDTGLETATGGRLRKLAPYLDQTFVMTYGDGLSDVNLQELVKFHSEIGTLATVTAVQPPARFGALELEGDQVTAFREKSKTDVSWINGGFFVLNKEILKYIESDSIPFEESPLRTLADSGELSAFKHRGFWQPMDTLRDKLYLEDIWRNQVAPWARK
jgi:glucose-1-phosphate cytidylyltransferase